MTNEPLSARYALNIAAQYGFSIRSSQWERDLIRNCITDARAEHAKPPFDGRRRKNAVQYFDECMAKVAADVRAESKTYGVPVSRLGLLG